MGSNPTQGIPSFSLEKKSCPGCSWFVCCAFAFLYLLVFTCYATAWCWIVLPLHQSTVDKFIVKHCSITIKHCSITVIWHHDVNVTVRSGVGHEYSCWRHGQIAKISRYRLPSAPRASPYVWKHALPAIRVGDNREGLMKICGSGKHAVHALAALLCATVGCSLAGHGIVNNYTRGSLARI